MGILKFIFTFIFFYYAIKIIRSVFFVSKTIRQAKDQVRRHSQEAGPKKPSEDIIDADYKVVDE